MSKIWKIAGSVVVAVVVLIAFVIFKAFIVTNTASLGTSSMGGTMGLSGSSNPLFMGMPESSLKNNAALYQESVVVQDLPQTDKKVIKNGTLNLKVDSADATVKEVGVIARGNGGEIFSSNFYQSANNVKSGTVTVKVPVANFEKVFEEIKSVAALVLQESTSGRDVTEQYIDLQAQLTNARAEEQSFARILDQAQKIDDVLAVTRELSRVRGTIEQLQGRMKYLASQTDMSLISVNLTENQNITVTDSWRPFQILKDSVNVLIKGLQQFIDVGIYFLIVILPLLIVWGIILWLIYKFVRKMYLKIIANDKTP